MYDSLFKHCRCVLLLWYLLVVYNNQLCPLQDSSAATAGSSKGIDRKRLLSESDEEREDSPGPSKRVRIDGE